MALQLHIDPRAATPIWAQIEQQVRLLIGRGALEVGEPVPSVRDLAKELVLNPATVAKAYRALVDLGLLEVRRGQGTFVARVPDDARVAREAEVAARQLAATAKAGGMSLAATKRLLADTWSELSAVDETEAKAVSGGRG